MSEQIQPGTTTPAPAAAPAPAPAEPAPAAPDPAPAAAPVPAEPAPPSLEEIAAQFTPPPAPAAPVAAPVQQTPPVQSAPVPASMPDPKTHPDEYAQWQAETFQAMNTQFQQTQAQLQAHQAEQAKQVEVADIQSAVGQIASGVEHANNKAIEGFLHFKYVNDPNFQKIWQNRSANPQAYSTALQTLQQEYKREFATTVDPQIQENQRAMEQSYQHAPQGYDPNSAERQRWASMDEDSFDRSWAEMSGMPL